MEDNPSSAKAGTDRRSPRSVITLYCTTYSLHSYIHIRGTRPITLGGGGECLVVVGTNELDV